MRANTETVFSVSLPTLIEQDAIQIPTTLRFNLSTEMLPVLMMKKALWYVENQSRHVLVVPDRTGEVPVFFYYFLRKDNPLECKQIHKRLVNLYTLCAKGEDHADFEDDFDFVREVCASFHCVTDAQEPWGCIECPANGARLVCICKSFKQTGICSHVLSINHTLQHVNLRAWLQVIGKKAKKKGQANKGGNNQKAVPALTRAPQREPDSSDEEAERLLAQGAAGQ